MCHRHAVVMQLCCKWDQAEVLLHSSQEAFAVASLTAVLSRSAALHQIACNSELRLAPAVRQRLLAFTTTGKRPTWHKAAVQGPGLPQQNRTQQGQGRGQGRGQGLGQG